MNDMLALLQSYSGAISIVVAIAAALIATRFVTKEQHEKAIASLDAKFVVAIEKVDKVEDRTARLENDFRHLPDRDSVHRMEVSLTELRGELKSMGEQLRPVAAIADRVQDFLLEQAKR